MPFINLTVSLKLYSLVNCVEHQFIDHVVQTGDLNAALYIMHHWLRLLVSYHSPGLSQYLDRTVPGWEQPMIFDSSVKVLFIP